MGTTNLLLSLFGWSFVPDFATKHLLNFLYTRSPVKPFKVSQPGSLQHRKHYAITFAFVIFSYLGYTLYQSARAMPPSFYQVLGVPSNVDENGLKLAFRAFAKRYHPDRPEVGKDGEALFMYVRDAYEALKDPVVRFAYDRFGPDVVAWSQTCKTTREFMHRGLMVSSGYHIVTGIALLFWSAIGRPSPVSFWRYVLFAALFAGELSLILSPFPAVSSDVAPPSSSFFSFLSSNTTDAPNALSLASIFPATTLLESIFPTRVPYQHILFLHQLFMFLSVALSRVVPQFIFLLSDDANPDAKQLNDIEKIVWERVYGTLAIADREASIILHTVLRSILPSSSPSAQQPYHDPTLARPHPLTTSEAKAALDKLTPEMRNLVIEANIKNQVVGPVATAWDAALRHATNALLTSSSQGDPNTSAAAPKISKRPKNFWEKDIAEAEGVVTPADDASFPSSTSGNDSGSNTSTRRSRSGSPHKQSRIPVPKSMSGRDSPTKSHSPVREGTREN